MHAKEVILCGGAINSPQLLLLAGIGPKADLEALGIPVVADLPGVGSNLQDHLEVYIQYASKQPVSIGPWLKHRHKPAHRRRVAVPAQRASAPPTTSRPAASSAATTGSTTPT